MGRRNIEHFSIRDFRACDTVQKMFEARWTIMRRCERCKDQGDVRLKPIIEKMGPHFVLWDRRPLCKRGCGDRIYFWAQMPGSPKIEPLTSERVELAPYSFLSGAWR